jgi:hypothetical protein
MTSQNRELCLFLAIQTPDLDDTQNPASAGIYVVKICIHAGQKEQRLFEPASRALIDNQTSLFGIFTEHLNHHTNIWRAGATPDYRGIR